MYFDELGMGDTQFSSSGGDFVDDKSDSDIAHFGLSNPIPACPSENIMGEGGIKSTNASCACKCFFVCVGGASQMYRL